MTGGYFLLSVNNPKKQGSDQVFILGHRTIFPLYKDEDTKIRSVFLPQSTYHTCGNLQATCVHENHFFFTGIFFEQDIPVPYHTRKLLLQMPFLVPEVDSLCPVLLLDYDLNYLLFGGKKKNNKRMKYNPYVVRMRKRKLLII